MISVLSIKQKAAHRSYNKLTVFYQYSEKLWLKATLNYMHLNRCHQIPQKDHNQQCVSPFLNILILLYPVCGAQPQAHWFLLKIYIFKQKLQIHTFSFLKAL